MIGTRNLVCAWYFLKGNNEAITGMDTGKKDLVTAFLLSIALGVGLELLIFVGGMIFTPSGFGKWSSQGLSIILGPVLQTSLFLLGLWLVLRLMQLADYFTQLAVATLWFGLVQYALLFPFTLASSLLMLAGAAIGLLRRQTHSGNWNDRGWGLSPLSILQALHHAPVFSSWESTYFVCA